MMRPYVISACSPADLNKQYFEERNIPYLCFEYELADTPIQMTYLNLCPLATSIKRW